MSIRATVFATIVAAFGCSSGESMTPMDGGGGGEVLPINLTFSFHLEGTPLVATQVAFDKYVTDIRSTVDVFHRNGAIATWEAAEIVEKSKIYGTNILLELEQGGDAVGLHANGVGYAPSDPNYTLDKMKTELAKQRANIDALGVRVRHVSNICSAVDWVNAVQASNFEAVTGTVDYCLKALSNPPSEAVNCPSPDKCHDAYPHGIPESISPWYAQSGANWTTPTSSGLLILPNPGGVPCAAEVAAGTISPTQCPYGDDDVTAVMNELASAIAARQPGKVHTFGFVASFGQKPVATVIEKLLQQIKTTYVDTGKAKWAKVPDVIDLVKNAK